MRKALCFDDVLLSPRHYKGKSRSEIDLSTSIAGLELDIPLIAANMPAVCEEEMAIALAKRGGLGILHRMCPIERQVEMVKAVKANKVEVARFKRESLLPHQSFSMDGSLKVGASIGIGDDWLENATALVSAGVDLICLDVAFFAQERAHAVAYKFLSWFPNVPFVVGNISNGKHIVRFGPKGICYKVGIGSGHACTTRINTGCGEPTLSSILNCKSTLDHCSETLNTTIIADGGHKNAGDCVKSLAAGANAVMIGSLFAGTQESPGEVVDGKKKYFGNASAAGKASANMKVNHIEGDEMWILCKGSVDSVIDSLLEGIRSGMSYCGAKNLTELQNEADFIEITPAGFIEGTAHGKNRA